MTEQKRTEKRHGGGYKVCTENSINRQNVTQGDFESGIHFDDAVQEYPEKGNWVQYKQGGYYVAYFDPSNSRGYVSARALNGA